MVIQLFNLFSADEPVTTDKSDNTLVIVLVVCLSLVTIVVIVLVGYVFWKRRVVTRAKSTSKSNEIPLRCIKVSYQNVH